jgi:hypothetical protein
MASLTLRVHNGFSTCLRTTFTFGHNDRRWLVREPSTRLVAMRRFLAASGLTVAAFVAVVSIAGCGGTPNAAPGASTTSVAPSTSVDSTAAAYRDCLTQHGVDPSSLPTGGFGSGAANAEGSRGPRGTIDATRQAARDACQSLLPSGTGAGGGARSDADIQALRLYQSCLADNGVPVATQAPPSLGNGGPGGFLGGVDRNSPAFAAADAKCRVLLPAGAPTTSR